jgi:hypothetical protein
MSSAGVGLVKPVAAYGAKSRKTTARLPRGSPGIGAGQNQPSLA